MYIFLKENLHTENVKRAVYLHEEGTFSVERKGTYSEWVWKSRSSF